MRDLTVGEAAARLSAEFPGLTVSWLRRLEAAGRVSPRRNPAGFRRYSAADLDRIRAVLSEAAGAPGEHPPPTAVAAPAVAAPARESAPSPAIEPEPAAQGQRPLMRAAGLKRESSNPSGGRRGGPGGVAVLTVVPDTSPAEQQGSGPAAEPPEPAGRRGERRWPDPGFFAPDLGEVAMDRDRLAAAARIERGWIDELIGYGLLPDRAVFSGADLLVARACAELAELGFEPRHLRPVLASAAKVAELAGSAPPGRSAQAAAAAVRLHSTLVRAELLRG